MYRPCIESGCPELTTGTRCDAHKRSHQKERDERRGSPAERGYGNAWRRVRVQILERDGYRCHWCGGPATTVDHVRPKVQGGTDDPSNLVAACLSDNSKRGQAARRLA